MSDYYTLQQEIIALDHLINRQSEIIKGLKDMLRTSAVMMEQELALLGELSGEISLLRELREVRFRKRAALNDLEMNSPPAEGDRRLRIDPSQ